MSRNRVFTLAVLSLLMLPGAARATIIAGSAINGFSTFIDQNTNRNWLRLDSFSDNESYNTMAAAAAAADFAVATSAQVHGLLDTLPSTTTGQFDSYAAIMMPTGSDFIWAAFLPTNPAWVSYVTNERDFPEWIFLDGPLTGLGLDANPGVTGDTYMNLWAFYNGPPLQSSEVPEPMTLSLLGCGLFGLHALRRRASIKL